MVCRELQGYTRDYKDLQGYLWDSKQAVLSFTVITFFSTTLPISTLFILPSLTYEKSNSFGLALRLRCISGICSTDATFNTRAAQLTTYLLKGLYNSNFVTKQIRRASDIPSRLTLQTKDVKKTLTYTIYNYI